MEILPIKTLPSVFSLFKESFKIYKKYFWGLSGISIFYILLVIFHFLLNQILIPTVVDQIIFILGNILFTIISLVLICAIKIYISSEQKIERIVCWKKSVSLILPFFWITILSILVLIGSFFLLIVPGIIMFIYLSFVSYSLVFENQKGLNSLLRSFQLIRGNWWGIFWRRLCLIFLILLIYFIFFFVMGFNGFYSLILLLQGNTFLFLLLDSIITVIITPLSLIYEYLIFDALVKQKPLETFNP